MSRITPTQVRGLVADIEALQDDCEAAANKERELWESVLRAAACSTDREVAELASEALRTADLAFPRWV
jgi:hypothetical protein